MYNRFTFVENTINPESQVSRKWQTLVLLAYGSLVASTTLLQWLLAYLNFCFRVRRFILLIQAKKMISMSYGHSTGIWKQWRWVKFAVIFVMRNTYINSNLNLLTKFTSSSRSTKFKDILLWSISQMITKTIPIGTRIVICYTMKQGIPFWVWWKVNGNWDNMIRITNGGKVIVEQILALDERKKSKRAGLWNSQWGIQEGKLTIWVRSFEIEKL